ncbi:MAG: hypothetical protein MIO90_02850 [Methanomassiliicoccales archaeon]|nr:hypothetical protein [Methanomassiliicoccales archaeon]
MEIDENNVLTASVVVLAFLPDLSVSTASIAFSQNPGYAKQPMYINVTVSNVLGRKVAINAEVSYYIGNPMTGGHYLGSNFIEVAALGTNVSSFMWTPIQIGTYPIYVVVNEDRTINEYSYANNMASNTMVVILVADTNDWLIDSVWPTIQGASMSWQNNIIVEGEGFLSLTQTTLFMSQISTNLPTQIVVKDNGTLVLDQSTVDSNLVLRIYLFDNATLFVDSSTLRSNVILIMDDTSITYMEGATVMGDLQAPASSSAELVAFNTTFGRAWSYFGGSAVAELTGVSINGVPAVSPKDSAVVTLYSWIVASVYDGTGMHKIPGTHVEARSFIDQILYATGETNDSGVWQFRALSDVITSTGHGSVISGYYQLNATYWFDGERYDSDLNKVAQIPYSPDVPLIRDDAEVRLDVSTALPDIDPPFTVSTNQPLRGGDVTLSTIINNVGVVTGYDILVRFEDNSSTGKVLVEDYLIEELAPLSNVTVSVVWTATYPLGTRTLSVMVDPLDQIPELNETNNYNSTTVNVLGVPDLVVTASDIVVNPQFPARDVEASITVSVRNIGDNAIAAFNVSFYDEGALIDISEISNLPTGAVTTVSVTWTPTVPGLRNITVVLDQGYPGNVDGNITESNEANNLALKTVFVRDYPDLLASSVSFMVDGQGASKAFVNKEVTINAAIYNIGESTAEEFDVAFWLNGIEMLDIVRVESLPAGEVSMVSTTWVTEIVASMGLYQNNTIIVEVNPASNSTFVHISEMDDPVNANNVASQILQVIDNRPDMAVSTGRVQYAAVNVTSATIGQNIHVLFDLKNIGIIDATSIKVEVRLVNDTIDMLLHSQTRNLGAGETVPYDVVWLVNVTSGSYSVVISAHTGSDADLRDNVLDVNFSVTVPNPVISIDLNGKTDYAPGTSIFVQGTIVQSETSAPLANQVVWVKITDTSGFALTDEYSATTNANGQFSTWVPVPTGKEGSQILLVTVDTIEGEFSHGENINIVAPFAPETIPTWVYLLIVAIVIAVIVIFSLYLYRVGLGRMVECGNCGALIPDVSKHCPKCGVEFESGTAKCSECGAWIPSKAESCPECGAKFMTEPIEAGQPPGYIEAMRKQYEEYIGGFRDQAKAALGNKYSEEKFMEWLQTEPNYLPFEEWLRKEEMSRRSGVFPCPACGTLNPRDSKICNRCGTVFDHEGKAEPKVEEKKSPFRRIVRRSSETKEEPAKAPAEKLAEGEDKPAETPPEGEDKTQ